MSLKITHSVLIILSIALAGFLSFYMSNSNMEYSSIFSITSALLSILLTYYLFSIVKKFRTI